MRHTVELAAGGAFTPALRIYLRPVLWPTWLARTLTQFHACPAASGSIRRDVRVVWGKFMPVNAMRLRSALAISFRVASRTHGFHVEMVFRGITEVVVIFVTTLTRRMHVAAVCARQHIRGRTTTGADFDVDTLSRLLLVSVPRRLRCRTGPPCQRIHAIRPNFHSAFHLAVLAHWVTSSVGVAASVEKRESASSHCLMIWAACSRSIPTPP